ncbi:MAG TPA: CHAD domain-containing protein [Thermoleophilaceae bacterium]|nr:CHAD domain-containing protein [Thermoleophilaceae bacterium]
MAATGTARKAKRSSSARTYRLRADEPVGKGIARMARGRFAHAIDELRGKTDSTAEVAVHEARKDLKKLRSLLRLVRDGMGGATYRRENAALRDIGRSLSGVRDADVMLATLDDLEERFTGELPPDVAGGLRQALEAHRRMLDVDGDQDALPALDEARRRVRLWAPDGDDFDVVQGGLERGYRRGRQAWRSALADPSAETLHEWRKRAKDLWYHLLILRDAWPPVLEPLADQAHELSDRLGEDHDLALLSDFAYAHAPDLDGAERVEELVAVIAPRREELRAEAFDVGARLYADRPGAFSRRMRKLFEAWREPAAKH